MPERSVRNSSAPVRSVLERVTFFHRISDMADSVKSQFFTEKCSHTPPVRLT